MQIFCPAGRAVSLIDLKAALGNRCNDPDWMQLTMSIDTLALLAGHAFELVGVVVLIVGAVVACGAFLLRLGRGAGFNAAYHDLRADLGRAILLGLEFLVIADIIGTVAVEPTLHNLGVLAVIIAIRTLLSFALELEVSGRWPWQRPSIDAGREGRAGD